MTPIEQLIKERYEADNTLSSIAKELNAAGHRTIKKNKEFHSSDVSNIVSKLKLPRRQRARPRLRTYTEKSDLLIHPNITIRNGFEIPFDYDEDIDDNLAFPGARVKGPAKGWPYL